MINDITERKHTEDALIASEANLHQNMQGHLAELSVLYNVSRLSPGIERFLRQREADGNLCAPINEQPHPLIMANPYGETSPQALSPLTRTNQSRKVIKDYYPNIWLVRRSPAPPNLHQRNLRRREEADARGAHPLQPHASADV